ncbi:MAG TPA: DUF885 domain-containing protein [Vicinamibacteria bacterium]|nr:DUF885 domain-containing protein [Vicinamibacteria bacterium]
MRRLLVALTLVPLGASSFVAAQTTPAPAASPAPRPAWIVKSDAHADVPLKVAARFFPEGAGQIGVSGLDEQVLDLQPQLFERTQAANKEALAELERRRAAEADPLVRQDLDILIQSTKDQIEGDALERRYELTYFDVPLTMFRGLHALLDDQIAPERRAAALVRLKKYAGDAPGTTPLTVLAEQRMRERLGEASLLGPPRAEVEKNLGNTVFYLDGIEKLFQKYQVAGYEAPLAKLKTQVGAYNEFVKGTILPRSRTDFRLPPELYRSRLKNFGVDMAPETLADRARVSYVEIRNEMRAIAPLVAKEKGLSVTDYRDVLRALKKDQIVGEAILPHYQQRLASLEEIIRRERVVTLPTRPAQIKLASEAESAAQPAPNMRPPRLLGNTGERGTFMLPLRVPTTGAAGSEVKAYDDFTFGAASWTLTVHEARPGHELQFASIVEKGVSAARAVFAFNSVNVEGWALYMEAEMKPYLPLDGQLASLQARLLRAMRAFLDPELQMGRIQPEEAVKFLMDEGVYSEAMARQEVERYTFRAPGQATSYYYGYTRWMQLRSQAEMALGAKFDRLRYHDFILSQGLLPPDVLAKAVLTDFVAAEKAR